MKRQTFLSAIEGLSRQFDIDKERAELLSDIYGSDINPNDNSLLTDSIFGLMEDVLSEEQMDDIRYFCYDQDFGRAVNKSIEQLWEEIIDSKECNSCVNNTCICNN